MGVFIVDREVLVREGLARILTLEGYLCRMVSSVWDLQTPDSTAPRGFILTPATMDQGPVAVAHLKQMYPRTPVLVLASSVTEEIVRRCLLAGAEGFLVRWAHPHERLKAVDMVLHGHAYLHPEVVSSVIDGLRGTTKDPRQELSEKELEILKLVSVGQSNAQIAAQLFISPGTVKNRLRKLFEKYSVSDRTQLVAEAMKAGFLQP